MVERRGALRWAMSPPYGNSLIAAGTSASKEARVCAEAGMHTLADPGRLGSFVPRLHGQPYLGSIKRTAAKRRQLPAE
jgi:hypothetical protein